MDWKAEAKKILKYYMRMSWTHGGDLGWNDDHDAETDALVEAVVAAAVQQIKDEIQQGVWVPKGRKK
jgi:hypothetical protein